MKKILTKINNWRFIILIIIIGGTFYWFELRPANIRKECLHTSFTSQKIECDGSENGLYAKFCEDNNKVTSKLSEKEYIQCLRSKGLNK